MDVRSQSQNRYWLSGARASAADGAGSFNTVHLWHDHVHQYQIDSLSLNDFKGFLTSACVVDTDPGPLAKQHLAQQKSVDRMVINDEHTPMW